jgi:hypothetical protein
MLKRLIHASSLIWPALAQDPPTGIAKGGPVSMIRAEGKSSGTVFTTEILVAGFVSTDYANYTAPPVPETTKVGLCFLNTYTPPATGITPPVVTSLDAGPVLTLIEPNGTKQFPATKRGASISYGGDLGGGMAIPFLLPPAPLDIHPGTYTVDNGPGGADIGPLTATLNVPAPAYAWTTADASPTISRADGVDILWSGGDPNALVSITGTASILDPVTFKVSAGGAFGCLVPNTGEFFIGADIMATLPATPVNAAAGTSTPTVSTDINVDMRRPEPMWASSHSTRAEPETFSTSKIFM